jgi:hypothetical protein
VKEGGSLTECGLGPRILRLLANTYIDQAERYLEGKQEKDWGGGGGGMSQYIFCRVDTILVLFLIQKGRMRS